MGAMTGLDPLGYGREKTVAHRRRVEARELDFQSADSANKANKIYSKIGAPSPPPTPTTLNSTRALSLVLSRPKSRLSAHAAPRLRLPPTYPRHLPLPLPDVLIF
jgi:hypothetical protein